MKLIKKLNIRGEYYPWILSGLIFLIGLVLSFFRWASQDEVGYLYDTMIISERLKVLEWFGNDSVGMHGFLFKLPVAIIYLFSGPNIWIATFFNIILASISTFILYKITLHFLKNYTFAFLSIILSFFSYYFILILPTYLRDIPVLLALLLFVFSIIKSKPFWLLGLIFLLVMDAKEYIGIILIPVIIIWIIITEWNNKNNIKYFFLNISKNFTLIFLPTFIWIFMMFWTSVIPINPHIANLVNFTISDRNIAEFSINQQSASFGTKKNKVNILSHYNNKQQSKKIISIKDHAPVKKALELYDKLPERKIKQEKKKKNIIPIQNGKNKISKGRDLKINQIKKVKKRQAIIELMNVEKKLDVAYKYQPKIIKPAETKPAETKPAETKLAVSKPAVSKPAVSKPAETKPAETKPAETKPAETKPAETKPAVSKPAVSKPAVSKPAVSKLVKSKDKIHKKRISDRTISKNKIKKIKDKKQITRGTDLIKKINNISLSAINILFVYIQKILSPRIFSYLSIPLFMIIISIFGWIDLVKNNWKKSEYLFIGIYFIVYLIIYILRPSHARYLIHLIPFISLFALKLFFEGTNNYKKILTPFLIAVPLTIFTLYFEITMPEIKALSYLFFFAMIGLIIYMSYKNKVKTAKKILITFILLFSFFTSGSALFQSTTQGQIKNSIVYGNNNEYDEIAKCFNPNKRYWFNGEKRLINFYNKNINQGILPWRFGKGYGYVLKEWIPKHNIENKYNYLPNFFNYHGPGTKKGIQKYGIDAVAIIIQNNDIKKDFRYSEYLFRSKAWLSVIPKWLKLEKIKNLKNKQIYLYKVLYE